MHGSTAPQLETPGYLVHVVNRYLELPMAGRRKRSKAQTHGITTYCDETALDDGQGNLRGSLWKFTANSTRIR